MAVEMTIKRWGNSLGIILPKNEIEKQHLRTNDKILVEIVKEANLSEAFGSLKSKISGQNFKDIVRKGLE